MKIAVTGASGFLGTHVLRALALRADVSVVATSRTAPKAMPANVEFISSDVAEPEGVFARLERPDVVIHLAWNGLPNYMSLHHFESELPNQYRFLRDLVADGLPRLVVTGTCYEYGMREGALCEGDPTEPTNPYGYAKDALRRQLEMLAAVEPFQLIWARLFYMWGEGQAPNSLYPQLKAAVERGEANFAMSFGDQLRDYLPVETVADSLACLALAVDETGTVNICSGVPISVRALVEHWIDDHQWAITPDRGKYAYPNYEPFAFWGSSQRLNASQTYDFQGKTDARNHRPHV